MSARDIILAAVVKAQPPIIPLPDDAAIPAGNGDKISTFVTLLEGIGGQVVNVNSYAEIEAFIRTTFPSGHRVITTCPRLPGFHNGGLQPGKPHDLLNVDLAVLESNLAVAENGAVWITELPERVAPFICQHLAVIIAPTAIVSDMHQAYDKIAANDFDFGVFIAGPSKTADIEQSLVLGAHGPKSMTIFLFQPDSFVI